MPQTSTENPMLTAEQAKPLAINTLAGLNIVGAEADLIISASYKAYEAMFERWLKLNEQAKIQTIAGLATIALKIREKNPQEAYKTAVLLALLQGEVQVK